MKRPQSGYPLPTKITNHKTTCFKIEIPNDATYISDFIAHLDLLGHWFTWEHNALWRRMIGRDDRASVAARYWQNEIVQPAIDRFLAGNGCDCPDTADNCRDIYPDDTAVSIHPENPFRTGDVSFGWQKQAFTIGSKALSIMDLQPKDIVTTMDNYPRLLGLPNPLAFYAVGGTRVSLSVEGSGELEVHLLSVPQGGIAMIVPDRRYREVQFVDLSSSTVLDLDITSLTAAIESILNTSIQGGFFGEEIIEFTFKSGGWHRLDIYFLPRPAVDLTAGYGGGLRKFVWCSDQQKTAEEAKPKTKVEGNKVYWWYGEKWHFLTETDTNCTCCNEDDDCFFSEQYTELFPCE